MSPRELDERQNRAQALTELLARHGLPSPPPVVTQPGYPERHIRFRLLPLMYVARRREELHPVSL